MKGRLVFAATPRMEGGSWVSKGADEFLGGDVVECGPGAPTRSEIEAWEHLERTGVLPRLLS